MTSIHTYTDIINSYSHTQQTKSGANKTRETRTLYGRWCVYISYIWNIYIYIYIYIFIERERERERERVTFAPCA